MDTLNVKKHCLPFAGSAMLSLFTSGISTNGSPIGDNHFAIPIKGFFSIPFE
ncbi:hypothetical protein [Enterococcus casseliflavus]|uniref:hypothetical protein n=1 Tax=Enterococcus casseliflavus TaxID=37734 RepID=UPI001AD7D5DC|nr:hypothetical protein [Enterococcus casseliflavus]